MSAQWLEWRLQTFGMLIFFPLKKKKCQIPWNIFRYCKRNKSQIIVLIGPKIAQLKHHHNFHNPSLHTMTVWYISNKSQKNKLMPSIHLYHRIYALCKNMPILCISLNINENSAKPSLILLSLFSSFSWRKDQ